MIEENSGRVLFARNAINHVFSVVDQDHDAVSPVEERKLADRHERFLSRAWRPAILKALPETKPEHHRQGRDLRADHHRHDVATVVAEKLSGTEREFGKRMTARPVPWHVAHHVSQRVSLPHSKQQTTALHGPLAVAMRRDFPQYFGFFSTKSFRYKGKRFGNHNKLLSQYEGTDGIKTGYIDASGFNLVATVQRRGVRLIGVVFGGRTGNSRNAHMMKILDKSFKRVKPADIQTQVASATVRPDLIPRSLPKTLPISPPRPSTLPVAPPSRQVKHRSIDVALAGQSAYLEDVIPAPSASDLPSRWSVQVGSFARRANAHRAAAQARRAADSVLGSTPARLTMVTRGNIPLWRVRFHNLDETQARSACAVLFAKGRPCVAIEEGSRRSG